MPRSLGCVEPDCGMAPLRVPDLDGARRCLTHNARAAAVARERNIAGGQNRRRTLPTSTAKPDVSSLRGLRRELRDVIHAVKIGAVAPEVGRVALYGVAVAIQLAELEVHGEITELERRLRTRADLRGLA